MSYEKVYLTSEVAERLEAAQSTIRKYAMALEKHGHTFMKNPKGARLFTESDVATLTRMKDLSAEAKLPIDQIAGMLGATPAAPRSATRSAEVSVASATPEIMAEFAALREENKELREEVRRNSEQLRAVLEALEKTQQLIAAASEQPPEKEKVEETVEQPEKKKWWRFW